eukprot:2396216-Amphidinium_carterae.1
MQRTRVSQPAIYDNNRTLPSPQQPPEASVQHRITFFNKKTLDQTCEGLDRVKGPIYPQEPIIPVSYTHLRAHETEADL